MHVENIFKRSHEKRPFKLEKITDAILKAMISVKNGDLEDALSFLSRVTIFHADQESWDTLATFAEMLVDEYLRDPFYERLPNLQTIERLSHLWIKQTSARIYYGRLNDTGEWTYGYSLNLYRGGLREAHAKEAQAPRSER